MPVVSVEGGYVYENLMDRGHSFWIGGITVSVPISNGGAARMK